MDEKNLILLDLETKSGQVTYSLCAKKKQDTFIWQEHNGAQDIIIYCDESGTISEIKKVDSILTDETIIKEKFHHKYINLSESGIEISGEHTKPEPFPYDPEQIRIAPRNFSIEYVYTMIKDEDIDLHPEFQRNFVWTGLKIKSRLIESILLKIPLPVFYVAQDKEGYWIVIDGLQRLTVIRDFMENKFKLTYLEYLVKECEGCYFSKKNGPHLAPKYKKRLEQAQLSFNIVEPQTPFDVKFDIFRRLNIGGKPLNRQEIRNSMAKKHIRKFIKKLLNTQDFKKAIDGGVSSIRMADQELILKYIAFYLIEHKKVEYLKYTGELPVLLDKCIQILNDFNPENPIFSEIEESFSSAMRIAFYLFKEYSFRKFREDGKKGLLNTQLFLSFTLVLSGYNEDEIKKQLSPGALIEPLKKLLEIRIYFDSISYGINSDTKIKFSIVVAKELINHALKGTKNDPFTMAKEIINSALKGTKNDP